MTDNPLCRLLGRLPGTYEDFIEEVEHLLCGAHDHKKPHILHELIEHLENVEHEHPLHRFVD